VRRSEQGQTLVLIALLMPVMLLFAALVMDTGYWLTVKRSLQGNADAAAMAAVRDLPQSSRARATAHEYVESQNDDEGVLRSANVSMNNSRIDIVVERKTPGLWQGITHQEPTIVASASAQAMQMKKAVGMIPFAFMPGFWTLGQQADVRTTGSASNHGVIAPDRNPPSCASSSGASDYEQLLRGASAGGQDACAYELDQNLNTEPGNMAGPTQVALDARVGSNRDSFEDVFAYDNETGLYTVVKPDSPRLILVPIVVPVDGAAVWPSGRSPMHIIGFMFGYLGKRDSSGYPPYTDNGKSVWITPVSAVLPNTYKKAEFDRGPADWTEEVPRTYMLTE
jgi:hypothetical protein